MTSPITINHQVLGLILFALLVMVAVGSVVRSGAEIGDRKWW